MPVFGVRLYKQCSSNNTNAHKYIVYRNFRKLNEDEFLRDLYEIPWDSAFVFKEVTNVIDAGYHLFNDVINTHVSLIKKRVKNEMQPKWFTSELLKLIKSRDEKLKNAKLSNTEKDWADLKWAKARKSQQSQKTLVNDPKLYRQKYSHKLPHVSRRKL